MANVSDLAAKLGNLTKTESTQEEKKTNAFGGEAPATKEKKEVPKDANGVPFIKDANGEYRARTPEEAEKWQKSEALKNTKDSVSKELYALSSERVNGLEREVRELIASRLRIIGYITAKGDKIDFAASGKTIEGSTEKEYTISLKNSAPSAIQYAIVKEPTALIMFKDALASMQADKAMEQYNVYKNTPANEASYSIKYIPWDEMITYVMANTNGVIYEDDKIFTQYVKGTSNGEKQNAKVYNTPADIKPHNGVPAGSCLYLFARLAQVKREKTKDGSVSDTVDAKSVVTLKHSVRSKIITPANVVPLKRFQTIAPAASYGDTDAVEMVNLYLGKFNTAKEGKVPVAKNLRDPQGFTIDPTTGIVKSDYFATGGAQSWFGNSANSVAHWADKNSDGSAKQIPATAVKLVKKELVKTKNGNTKIATLTDELGAADTAAAYQFSATTFPKVFAAAGSLKLDFEELSKAIASTKTRKPKASTKTKRTTYVAPDALIGLELSEIASKLKANFGFKA